MKYSSVWTAFALAASVVAVPSRRTDFRIKESVAIPRRWVKRDSAPRDLHINLRFALPQSNFPLLEQLLYEVSDPSHESYGAHLSQAEVNELIAPHPESVRQVKAWLASYGLREEDMSCSPAEDWIKVKVPIGLAEEMLDTEYHMWDHPEGDSFVLATAYSLPEYLHEHVELVQPTTLFSRLRSMKTTLHFAPSGASSAAVANAPPIAVPSASNGQVDASCNSTITISCIRQLYNAANYTPLADTGNQIAVTGYMEQFASFSDLQTFFAEQVPSAVNSSFQVVSINGGQNDQSMLGSGEANLDTQFAFGLAHPIPPTFYSTGGSPPFIPDELTVNNTNEPYLEWVEFVLQHPNPPTTISTSYGDDEQSVPTSYATRVCSLFAQLGARGVTLIFSSGDSGVGDGNPDPATQECFANDGTNQTRFLPAFPASCPYVTAVGGTVQIPEVAVNFSGGGFSNIFSQPAYQSQQVENFLKTLPNGTYAGLFNASGRAYPDVSAQAVNFSIVFEGEPAGVSGTSCASPTFAGLVALLNDARLRNGMPSLGFLNPMLYALNGAGFNDITSGNNPGCGTPGFNATVGWDPVTGLGTPSFGKLKDLIGITD